VIVLYILVYEYCTGVPIPNNNKKSKIFHSLMPSMTIDVVYSKANSYNFVVS